MQTRTIQVANISDLAGEREIREFFSFTGDSEHIEIRGDVGGWRVAFVTFKDPKALEIALLLSRATIVDQIVSITPVEAYIPRIEERVMVNDVTNEAPVGIYASTVEGKSSHSGGRVYVSKADDAVAAMMAKGSAIRQDAINKAKAFDEKHPLMATASAKVISFDKQVGFSEKITVGISVVNDKVKSVDQKLRVSDKTMAALIVAERKLNNTGTAVKTNSANTGLTKQLMVPPMRETIAKPNANASPLQNGHGYSNTVIEHDDLMTSPLAVSSAAAGEPTADGSSPHSNGTRSTTWHSHPTLGSLPLKDRVAIVTGGSGGIGSAIAAHLASLGAKVVIGHLGDPGPAARLVAEINSAHDGSGPQAVAVEVDVADPAQVKSMFDLAQLAFGPRIHIVVLAAGVQDPKYPPLAETSLEQWECVFNTNAKGTFLCCREAANRVVRGGGGRIVTMSSSTVGLLRPGHSTYSASKGAIEVMTRILAKELKGTGITVNGVAPGPIATALFYKGKSEERVRAVAAESPMGRLGEPRDVAPVVGFLASDAGEWINGQIIRINGGYV